jgi:hypothetical protein
VYGVKLRFCVKSASRIAREVKFPAQHAAGQEEQCWGWDDGSATCGVKFRVPLFPSMRRARTAPIAVVARIGGAVCCSNGGRVCVVLHSAGNRGVSNGGLYSVRGVTSNDDKGAGIESSSHGVPDGLYTRATCALCVGSQHSRSSGCARGSDVPARIMAVPCRPPRVEFSPFRRVGVRILCPRAQSGWAGGWSKE